MSRLDYSNGYYEGDVVKDKKVGKGVFIWSSGGKYEGEWKDDKFHGQGTYRFANYLCFNGEFRNGEPFHGEGHWKNDKGEFIRIRLNNGVKY